MSLAFKLESKEWIQDRSDEPTPPRSGNRWSWGAILDKARAKEEEKKKKKEAASPLPTFIPQRDPLSEMVRQCMLSCPLKLEAVHTSNYRTERRHVISFSFKKDREGKPIPSTRASEKADSPRIKREATGSTTAATSSTTTSGSSSSSSPREGGKEPKLYMGCPVVEPSVPVAATTPFESRSPPLSYVPRHPFSFIHKMVQRHVTKEETEKHHREKRLEIAKRELERIRQIEGEQLKASVKTVESSPSVLLDKLDQLIPYDTPDYDGPLWQRQLSAELKMDKQVSSGTYREYDSDDEDDNPYGMIYKKPKRRKARKSRVPSIATASKTKSRKAPRPLTGKRRRSLTLS